MIKVNIKRKEPTATVLENLYTTIKGVDKFKEHYYTKEQIEELKQDQSNVFLGGKDGK